MNDQEFAALLLITHESRGREFKGPGPLTDKHLAAKVVRACLSMANRRDGGLVVIGVEDTHSALQPVGLTAADLATWTYDHVADVLAKYADPPINFDLEIRRYQAAEFVLMRIHEFEDVPILCKRDFPDVLRDGACYVRSRRKPETAEIPTQTEMRELLEVAAEKRLAALLSQARRAGLDLSSQAAPSHEELFDQQLKGWTGDVDPILSRGHWRIIIRPDRFEESRIKSLSEIRDLVQREAVDIIGWDFPHVYGSAIPEQSTESIGLDLDWSFIRESWRFFRSGQFAYMQGFYEDWLEGQSDIGIPRGYHAQTYLRVQGVIVRLVEVFEYAARLAVTAPYLNAARLEVKIEAGNLKGRRLDMSPGYLQPDIRDFEASQNVFTYARTIDRDDLVSRVQEYAADAAAQLFETFGWKVDRSLLRGMQPQISGRN